MVILLFLMALSKKDKYKKSDDDELLVFGYSCKLFRDDEKAQIIDEGQHLIPWMGIDNLKIDRYDARATLYDLTHTEAPPGGYDRFIELTESEKALELACDEERYRSLHTNDEEDKLYKEEEEKRSEASDGKAYGQVEYSYVENKPQEPGKVDVEVEDDRPFVAPPILDIPVNMPLPATMKHNAVIEKTAMFISSQGAQMEIILKAKQAGNPLFDFLTFGNVLHGYYRLVLSYIKSGRYIPSTNNDNSPEEPEPISESTMVSQRLTVESAPAINTTTSHNDELTSTVYSDLLSQLKKKAQELKQKEKEAQKSTKTGSNVEMETENLPPKDTLVSIAKMASYASRNGRDFEAIVKTKKDPRYEFLEPSHVFHNYYLHKISLYKKLAEEKAKAKVDEKVRKEAHTGKVAPICFAIKPKETPCVREKSALPLEDNSDEEKLDEKEVNESEDKNQLDFDLVDDQVKIPVVKDKKLQLERKRKVSAFLRTLNVKDNSDISSAAKISRVRSGSMDDDSQ